MEPVYFDKFEPYVGGDERSFAAILVQKMHFRYFTQHKPLSDITDAIALPPPQPQGQQTKPLDKNQNKQNKKSGDNRSIWLGGLLAIAFLIVIALLVAQPHLEGRAIASIMLSINKPFGLKSQLLCSGKVQFDNGTRLL